MSDTNNNNNNNNNEYQDGFLSLTQGQRFNNKKYNDVKKSKKPSSSSSSSNKKPLHHKEGFTMPEDTNTGTGIPVFIKEYTGRKAVNAQNQANMVELDALQSKYDELHTQ